MGRINRANLKKAAYYLKRNGIRKTWYAVRERMEEKKQPPYRWMPPLETELDAQRIGWKENGFTVTFSILVPVYRTKPEYLRELIDSLCRQTYPKWELILADATEDDSVARFLFHDRDMRGTDPVSSGGDTGIGSQDSRIRYVHLERNAGIAENTNQALPYATGEYVGLLDHDDILTENALYEMAAAIEKGKRQGLCPRMLYSDEDKCNGDRTEYYEPNFKEDFNLDLLLSNNYICHFLVMDGELIRRLKFRREYEGAQDYDLVLRAAAELCGCVAPDACRQEGVSFRRPEKDGTIVHIPKVLYHWRCHTGSTAENPRSKLYAYEAGRRAIQDFADRAGWKAKTVDTAHVGFYRLQYEGSVFDCRPDIGAIGGRVTDQFSGAVFKTGKRSRFSGAEPVKTGQVSPAATGKGKQEPYIGLRKRRQFFGNRPVGKKRITGGRMTENGKVFYENLPVYYSGYLHRAVLSQDGDAVDIRNIQIRPECRDIFQKIIGVPYKTLPREDRFDVSILPENSDYIRLSLKLCQALGEAGYRILYQPDFP